MTRITVLSFLFFSSIIFSFEVNGQQFEPSILILSPTNTSADKKLTKEISTVDKQINKNLAKRREDIEGLIEQAKNRPENVRLMYQKKLEFSKQMNFYDLIPTISEEYLQYRFFQRFKNVLLYAVHEPSSDDLEQLSKLSSEFNMQYVVSFPKVELSTKGTAKRATLRVQLYDSLQKKLVLDKEFTGSDENPGFEFACTDKSIECTINNALAQALNEIVVIIATDSPIFARERKLAEDRSEILLSNYYFTPPSNRIVEIIQENDTSISTTGFYHAVVNEDQTKFVSFFAINKSAENFEEVRDANDRNVQIVTNSDNFFEEVPEIYAFIVVGLYYESKWYFERKNVTYFDAEDFEAGKKGYFNQLQKWNFFRENSTEINPEFWELNFFEKVKDVRNEPDYEKYYDAIYKSQERRNEGYVGMYKLVADQLRKEQTQRFKLFEQQLIVETILPFLNQQKTKNLPDFFDYSTLNETFTLIYPKDLSVVLCPVSVINSKGVKHLRYFVIFPATNEIYEWTYLTPKTLKANHYGSDIVEHLEGVAGWNYGYDTLDDSSFWDNYVLLKKEGGFEYLVKK